MKNTPFDVPPLVAAPERLACAPEPSHMDTDKCFQRLPSRILAIIDVQNSVTASLKRPAPYPICRCLMNLRPEPPNYRIIHDYAVPVAGETWSSDRKKKHLN